MSNGLLVEGLFGQVIVEVSLFDVVHDDVDFLFVLEGVPNFDKIRVVGTAQSLLNHVGLEEVLLF